MDWRRERDGVEETSGLEERERRGRANKWTGGERKGTSKGKYFPSPPPNFFF